MGTLHLIASVKKKADRPAPVAELYLSPWFLKAWAYVERQGAPWYIFSARYGLLDPKEVIVPYDETLAATKMALRRAWRVRVISQLARTGYPGAAPVVVLAGERYRHL